MTNRMAGERQEYDGYRALAYVYDRLNAQVDYEAMADFAQACFETYLPQSPTLVLDLACGTGSLTFALARRGYDMIGVDGSEDMLTVALDRRAELGLPGVLFLKQDMREFELYGTVGAITCALDSVNYLLTAEDVRACFACAHNYLDPDGLFLFDVNTPYKFSHIYSDNAYVLEDTLPDDGGTDSRTDGELGRGAERGGRNVFCGWQNDFDAESGRCLFRLSLFEETEDGRYERADEEQEEQCYDRQTLEALLTGTGFEVLGCFGDLHFGAPDERTPRWYFVARCKK